MAVPILLVLRLHLVTTRRIYTTLGGARPPRIWALCAVLFWWSQCYDSGRADGRQPAAFSRARVTLDITVSPAPPTNFCFAASSPSPASLAALLFWESPLGVYTAQSAHRFFFCFVFFLAGEGRMPRC